MYLHVSRMASFKDTMRKHNETWRRWVSQLCAEQNLSARELARRAHVSHTLINRVLESGYVPETTFVEAIARGLGQDEQTAKEIAGISKKTNISADAEEEIKQGLARLYRLTPQGQRKVWDIFYAALRGEEKSQPSPDPQSPAT